MRLPTPRSDDADGQGRGPARPGWKGTGAVPELGDCDIFGLASGSFCQVLSVSVPVAFGTQFNRRPVRDGEAMIPFECSDRTPL